MRAFILFAALLTACTSQPALYAYLDSPLTLCAAGARTSTETEWLNNGRTLRLTSEPNAPELTFRGASATDEYYSGDGYRLEIQLGGVIELRRPDGAVLHDC